MNKNILVNFIDLNQAINRIIQGYILRKKQ